MNLALSPEQHQLADAAARLLAAVSPASEEETASDAAFWAEMAGLGWLAIGIPGERGGAGGSAADHAVLFRELGRGLARGALLGTALGTAVAGQASATALEAAFMAGSATAALAEPWRDGTATAGPDGVSGTYRVLGTPSGSGYVTCLAPGGAAVVPAAAFLAHSRRLRAPDPTLPVSLAVATAVEPAAAVTGETAAAIVSQGRVLAAALLVGVLEATRDLSVAYATTREQFGKPIGTFQAVKHRCADMAVRAEAAGSLLWLAALSLEAGTPDRHTLAAEAKALASEYAVASAHDNVQNHGGTGFTAACSAHLYVKRALEWSVTLGSPDVLFAEVARDAVPLG